MNEISLDLDYCYLMRYDKDQNCGKYFGSLFLKFFVAVQGIELRPLPMLGQHWMSEPHFLPYEFLRAEKSLRVLQMWAKYIKCFYRRRLYYHSIRRKVYTENKTKNKQQQQLQNPFIFKKDIGNTGYRLVSIIHEEHQAQNYEMIK